MHSLIKNAAKVAAMTYQEREDADEKWLACEPGSPEQDQAWIERERARGDELHALRMLLLATQGVLLSEQGKLAEALEVSRALDAHCKRAMGGPR